MSRFFDWVISVLDAVSQFFGRLIFVRVDGEWVCWTESPNESISGASERWRLLGKFEWVAPSIDMFFLIITLGRNKFHCRDAFISDYIRARNYQTMAENADIALSDWSFGESGMTLEQIARNA